MGTLARTTVEKANSVLRQFKLDAQVFSNQEVLWYVREHTFLFDGKKYDYFIHQHNCGWPPGRMTERCVELALADQWLNEMSDVEVLEIGAVTPYYWPKRVREIVDPGDDHPLVTARTSMMDLDLTGRHILAVSTFEHIGNGEYGLPPAPTEVISAFHKLFREAESFLVTIPMGYNPTLDEFLGQPGAIPVDVSLRYLVRSPEGGNLWREADRPSTAEARYGPLDVDGNRGSWANAVAVLRRHSRASHSA